MTGSHPQHLPLVPSKDTFQNLLTPLMSEELYRNIRLPPNASDCAAPAASALAWVPLLALSRAKSWRLCGLILCVHPAQPQPRGMDEVSRGRMLSGMRVPPGTVPQHQQSRAAPVRVMGTDTAQRQPHQPIVMSDI